MTGSDIAHVTHVPRDLGSAARQSLHKDKQFLRNISNASLTGVEQLLGNDELSCLPLTTVEGEGAQHMADRCRAS